MLDPSKCNSSWPFDVFGILVEFADGLAYSRGDGEGFVDDLGEVRLDASVDDVVPADVPETAAPDSVAAAAAVVVVGVADPVAALGLLGDALA